MPFKSVSIIEACAVIENEGKFLMVRRPEDKGRYRNMWEFPHLETTDKDLRLVLQNYLNETWDVPAQIEEEWAEIRHTVTHHKITKKVFRGILNQNNDVENVEINDALQWANLKEIAKLPMGSPHQKILKLLNEQQLFFSS